MDKNTLYYCIILPLMPLLNHQSDLKNEKTQGLLVHRLTITKLRTWTIPVTACTVRRPYF